VKYVAPPFPNHPQNKRETENKKQNRKDIEEHSKGPMQCFSPSLFLRFHLARFLPRCSLMFDSATAKTGT